MNRHATLVHHRAWRLILTVATGNEDARRTLASEVGEDADAWYQIANIAALQVAQLLDAEYMAAEAMSSFADNPDLGRPETEEEAIALIAADRDTVFADPGITARARDYTIGRIERALADALDTPGHVHDTSPNERRKPWLVAAHAAGRGRLLFGGAQTGVYFCIRAGQMLSLVWRAARLRRGGHGKRQNLRLRRHFHVSLGSLDSPRVLNVLFPRVESDPMAPEEPRRWSGGT